MRMSQVFQYPKCTSFHSRKDAISITKLNAYGFNQNALNIIHKFLFKRS